jgi:rhamnose utilization protein RhaD (predicted bifunctional aldolase and dehydrogenase)
MDKALIELVKISRAVGKDSTLVLGTFGNTSVKTADGRYMYIKASGTAMKDMSVRKGWRRVKLDAVRAILTDKRFAKINADEKQDRLTELLLSACEDKFGSETIPSVETGFHSTLGRYVIHLHPAAVLAYVCSKKGRAEIEKIFSKKNICPAWVSYANPGCMLAERMRQSIGKHKKRYNRFPQVLFLQNHGLVVTADNMNTALKLVKETVSTCKTGLKQPKKVKIQKADRRKIAESVSGIREELSGITGRDLAVKYFINEVIATVMADKKAVKICAPPAVTPDELVYTGGAAMWLDKWDKWMLISKLRRRVKMPCGFLIKPLGLFVAGKKEKINFMKDVICIYLHVRKAAVKLGGIQFLSDRAATEIYRQIKKLK